MTRILRILLPLSVVALGLVLAITIVKARPSVDRQETAALPPLVRVMEVQPRSLHLVVRSQGTVRPVVESTLVAQVAGRVDGVSPSFAEGGFFSRGDTLVQIERRDYELTVAQADAQVAQAQVRLQLEQAEAELAREEWQQLGDGAGNPLALREPQLAEARAAVQAAEAALQKARLDLDRTTIRAPFDGRIRAKQVDLGQFVSRGSPVADVYSSEAAEIRLPLAKDELPFVGLDPSLRLSQDAVNRPAVVLRAVIGGTEFAWRGTIVRTGSEFDPRTRMLPLFARVEDPLRRTSAGSNPLPMGLFVDAEIDGIEVEDVFVIPRSALRAGPQVLVVDAEDRLRIRPVEVLRAEPDRVLIQYGLAPGERVCVSQIDSVVDGMSVRTMLDDTVGDLEGNEESSL